MLKPPYYNQYPRDFLGSQRVQLLSLAEEGAFRRALDFAWLHGSLPADPVKLAWLIGKGCSRKTVEAILDLFIPHPDKPGELVNERQEFERSKLEKFYQKQHENGSKGGRPKKNPDDNPVVNPKKPITEAEAEAEVKNKRESAGAVAPATRKIKSFKSWTRKDFIAEVERFREKYPDPLLRAFFLYWSESTASGTMLLQTKKSWETDRRLITWASKEPTFNASKKIENNEPFRAPEATNFAGTVYE